MTWTSTAVLETWGNTSNKVMGPWAIGGPQRISRGAPEVFRMRKMQSRKKLPKNREGKMGAQSLSCYGAPKSCQRPCQTVNRKLIASFVVVGLCLRAYIITVQLRQRFHFCISLWRKPLELREILLLM